MKVNVLHDIIEYYVRLNQDKEVNMKYDENDSRHPRYVAKIRETAGVHPDVVGHIRVIMKRLEIIESQIESMGNAQRRMWDLLDDTAELTALLSEAQDGID